jgi:hypothetical protein
MRIPGSVSVSLVLALFLAAAPSAFAQASITGTVRDTSGAVLPGVTVEASSPALIEKVRSATTDGNGQYRIVDLRAGQYTVTYSLAGFSTVKREGVALEGSFTATINIDLRVGELTETITVTGESPIVDVQSIRRQMVLDNDIISAIPSSRSYNNLIQLIPNSVNQAGAPTDVQVVPGMVVFGGFGGRSNEGRVNIDGISVGSAFNGAGVSSYIADVANAREIAMITSGGLGETEGGGPSLNVLPKEGGNSVRGTFFGSGSTSGMIGSNYTQELKDRGLTTPGEYRKVWDFNLGIGGPIAKDRVWFYANLREEGSERTVPGMFANVNAGDPTKWTYVADPSRPAVVAASYRITALRLTTQATPRNKFTIFWDQQRPCEGGAAPGYEGNACRKSGDGEIFAGSTAAPTPSASAIAAPETAAYRDYGNRVAQAKWTSPVNNRLLLEGGFGMYFSRYGGGQIPGLETESLIRVVEQCAPSCANNGNIPGLKLPVGQLVLEHQLEQLVERRGVARHRQPQHQVRLSGRSAASISERTSGTMSTSTYRTNNAIPDQITLNINRFLILQSVRFDAIYVQEQWTLGRMTAQGAIRYDHAWSYFPEQTVGPVRFFPTAVTYPRTTGVEGYHDLWPRGGIAYDLFGTGKTSIKFNFGRYLEAAQNGGLFIALNPTGRLSTTTTRTWTDNNRNYVADCNLQNPAAQDLSASGGDVCGPNASPNFGTQVFDSTLDPGLLSGWGVRSGDWQYGVSVQHEVLPRVAVEVGYQRRWLLNSLVTDNRARSPRTTPRSASRFPPTPAAGRWRRRAQWALQRHARAALRLNDNYQTLSSNYADWTQVANSINLNVTARMRNGLVLQGGFNSGTNTNDYCDIRNTVPEWTVVLAQSPTNPWCDTSSGWVTRATALGSYTIPKVDVQVSARCAATLAASSPRIGQRRTRRPSGSTVRLPAWAARRSP